MGGRSGRKRNDRAVRGAHDLLIDKEESELRQMIASSAYCIAYGSVRCAAGSALAIAHGVLMARFRTHTGKLVTCGFHLHAFIPASAFLAVRHGDEVPRRLRVSG